MTTNKKHNRRRGSNYTVVNIDNESGNIDEYAVMERGKPETALTLNGWDEVGAFDSEFADPVYVRGLFWSGVDWSE